MPCKYDDICKNKGNCHFCEEMGMFELDRSLFRCNTCPGSKNNSCQHAWDLSNIGNNCVVVGDSKNV